MKGLEFRAKIDQASRRELCCFGRWERRVAAACGCIWTEMSSITHHHVRERIGAHRNGFQLSDIPVTAARKCGGRSRAKLAL